MEYSIANTEGEQEEWKEAFNDLLLDDALKTLCAFLNTFGGKIVFGVTPAGKPTHLACDLDEAQRKVYDKTRSHLKPNGSPFFSVLLYESRLYIFVKPDSSNVYQYKGVIYKRTGSSTHTLTYAEAKALDQQRKQGVREISPGVFSRNSPGEVLKCTNPNCGYTEISGSSSMICVGGPPTESKCPSCGSTLSSNLG